MDAGVDAVGSAETVELGKGVPETGENDVLGSDAGKTAVAAASGAGVREASRMGETTAAGRLSPPISSAAPYRAGQRESARATPAMQNSNAAHTAAVRIRLIGCPHT